MHYSNSDRSGHMGRTHHTALNSTAHTARPGNSDDGKRAASSNNRWSSTARRPAAGRNQSGAKTWWIAPSKRCGTAVEPGPHLRNETFPRVNGPHPNGAAPGPRPARPNRGPKGAYENNRDRNRLGVVAGQDSWPEVAQLSSQLYPMTLPLGQKPEVEDFGKARPFISCAGHENSMVEVGWKGIAHREGRSG